MWCTFRLKGVGPSPEKACRDCLVEWLHWSIAPLVPRHSSHPWCRPLCHPICFAQEAKLAGLPNSLILHLKKKRNYKKNCTWSISLPDCCGDCFFLSTPQMKSGSYSKTSRIVVKTDLYRRRMCMVASQDLAKTPFVPQIPIGATKSRVKRKGTVSGVVWILPCSKAIPEKWTQALLLNICLYVLKILH